MCDTCSCSTDAQTAATPAAGGATAPREYRVTGMTCGHCVSSVAEEVSAIAGVRGVDVDLASGRVLVEGEGFTDAQVTAAVVEAGYEVAP